MNSLIVGAVEASLHRDAQDRPTGFVLNHGNERIVLEAGRTWIQCDRFKWVTRGLIESPQSFAVHADGSVELNGEHFAPTTPTDAGALAERLNRRHVAASPAKPKAKPESALSSIAPRPQRVEFRAHLDALGHVLIAASRGAEKTETGVRGIEHLAAEGWMTRPQRIHIDPLQRYIELDEERFDCTPAGVEALTAALNARYSPTFCGTASHAIEIRENPGSSTGFDVHFWISRAGTRFEIKGHLAQDKLDILQDHDRCDLLKPGIILRLSPPYLYLRRRRPDGSEEHIPDLPDVKYRSVTAAQLQRILNHPSIRQGTPDEQDAGEPSFSQEVEHPHAPQFPSTSQEGERPRAPQSPSAFREVERPHAPQAPITSHEGERPHAPLSPSAQSRVDANGAESTLFRETDPYRINQGVFRQLVVQFTIPVQDLLLSLPRVFQDRRFEILTLEPMEIESVLQLRGGGFFGFYLSHIGPDRIDLVYACRGTHIEWGTDKSALQPTAGAETSEFRGPSLRGLAQDNNHHFVFLVTPEYRDWVRPHDAACGGAFARFLTVEDWARDPGSCPLIWPRAN